MSETNGQASASRGGFARADRVWVLQAAGFFTFSMSLLGLAHLYVGRRLLGGLSGGAADAAWVILWLFFISMPLSFVVAVRGAKSLALARVAFWVAHGWMGVFSLGLVLAALLDLGALAWGLSGNLAFGPREESWALWALLVPTTAAGLWSARSLPRVRRLAVPMAGLGPGLEGFRIVQVTDLHIGQTLGRAFLDQVVARVNALDADLVAVTGDVVDGSVEQLAGEVEPLRDLRARHGVFFVTGNHEYYSGAAAWEEHFRGLGLEVLHNEHRVVTRGGDRLVVGGVPDFDGKRFQDESRPEQAFHGAPPGPRLLLAHQPRSVKAAARAGVDLQLSGHTHGGQLFPWMFLVRLQQPAVAGLKKLYGVWLYTSRGTGYWGPPLRLGAPSEISEITLVSPTSAGVASKASTSGRDQLEMSDVRRIGSAVRRGVPQGRIGTPVA